MLPGQASNNSCCCHKTATIAAIALPATAPFMEAEIEHQQRSFAKWSRS
jgi:hypothetical protein